MNQTKYKLSLLVTTLLSITVLAVAPAAASQGSDDVSSASGTPSTSQTTESSGGLGNHHRLGPIAKVDGTDDHSASEDAGSLRAQAKLDLAALRANHQERALAVRQKVCENHLKAIYNKLSAFDQAADKHLTRLNDIFTKLKDYQSTNNLTVSNYDSLVSDATAKQTAATDAVATLKSFGTTITCDSDDPAASLQAVKTAAHDARQSLQDYRKSLKALVVALHQAKGGTEDTQSTGGDQ